jgi:AbrB family looped-hinge helix DNA binding protein
MADHGEFFGSSTVGERGQIVLPADLRKKFGIHPGDRLIVVGLPGWSGESPGHVMLLKAEVLSKIVQHVEAQQKAFRKILKETQGGKTPAKKTR